MHLQNAECTPINPGAYPTHWPARPIGGLGPTPTTPPFLIEMRNAFDLSPLSDLKKLLGRISVASPCNEHQVNPGTKFYPRVRSMPPSISCSEKRNDFSIAYDPFHV